MANSIYKTLKKLGYEKEVNVGVRGPNREFVWYRYDRNYNVVRHAFVGKTDITLYGSTTDVFLTKMTVAEFMDLAA